MMYTITPGKITHQINRLCKIIVPDPTPAFVPVIPDSNSIQDECFDNVRRKIELEGGTIQHGWQIWEWPNVYVEAEFHAVWKSNDNSLIDVTPKDEHVDRILFFPDPIRVYEGRPIKNVIHALRRDKLIQDFLAISAEISTIKIENQNPNNPREFTVPLGPFQELCLQFEKRRDMLTREETENSLCFCGSLRKYKNCHAL